MNTCAHPRCAETVAGHELACRAHWNQLPELLRNRIWSNHKRNPGGKAHVAAIRAARVVWWRQVSETELRCHHCKTKHDVVVDVDTDFPTCLTCLKPEVDTLRRPGEGLLTCPRCRRTVIGLAAIGDGPSLCCHCQERILAAA